MLLSLLVANLIHCHLLTSEEMPKKRNSLKSLHNKFSVIQFVVSRVEMAFIFCLQIENSSFQGARQLFSPHSYSPAVPGLRSEGCILSERHVLLNFYTAILALRLNTVGYSYSQLQVNSLFNLVSSGQHAYISRWLLIIYLLFMFNMEEPSMSNTNLTCVSIEKMNPTALEIKSCF